LSHAVRRAPLPARGIERKGDDRMAMLAPPQLHVQVRLDERGKVHYKGRDPAGVYHPNSYMTIPIKDFARWKNAGKRTESKKVTDPVSGQNYIHHNGDFYQFNGKVPLNTPVGGALHKDLAKKFARDELIDRKRDDRTAGVLQPFDVGPYGRSVNIPGGRSYSKLPKAAWANNDHIPSGKSLRLRNPFHGAAAQAYAQGMTIAITADAHRRFSPTYGGRQKTRDYPRNAHGPQPRMRRMLHDSLHPTLAFHRDAEAMLEGTRTEPGYVGQTRLTQLGAYRTLYRMNTRMHEFAPLGMSQGVNPKAAAMSFSRHVVQPRSFDYAPLPGSQGQLIAHDFHQRMIKENFAV
jgi:hypothetical protein